MYSGRPTHRSLSPQESPNSFETWRRALQLDLSSDPHLGQFFHASVTWSRFSTRSPLRGFTDDDDTIPEDSRHTAAQKVNFLNYTLEFIANLCPMIRRHTIIRNTTSMNNVWEVICEYFRFPTFSSSDKSQVDNSSLVHLNVRNDCEITGQGLFCSKMGTEIENSCFNSVSSVADVPSFGVETDPMLFEMHTTDVHCHSTEIVVQHTVLDTDICSVANIEHSITTKKDKTKKNETDIGSNNSYDCYSHSTVVTNTSFELNLPSHIPQGHHTAAHFTLALDNGDSHLDPNTRVLHDQPPLLQETSGSTSECIKQELHEKSPVYDQSGIEADQLYDMSECVESTNVNTLCVQIASVYRCEGSVSIPPHMSVRLQIVIATRVIFLLDDLLWVLTDTQLKSAMLYGNSLSHMIEKSSQQSKQLAAEKLQKQVRSGADQLYMQQQQQSRPRSQTNEAKYFQKYDVQTTSYHLITSRVDLHLCDDTPAEKGGERKNWYRYTDNQGSRFTWVQELFKAFRAEATKAREVCKVLSPTQSPAHKTANQKSPAKSAQQTQNPQGVKGQGHANGQPPGQGQTGQRITKLLESCMVLKIEEFIIYRVSTADNKRNMPQKFFSSDKKALHLPSDMSVVHVEYTDYFFTDGIDYPGGERKNWYRYTDNQGSRFTWVQELFKAFRAEATKAREVCKVLSPTQSPAHKTANQKSPAKSAQQTQNPQGVKGQGHANGQPPGQGQTGQRITKLLESCMVLKIEEFIIYRVSTADNKRNMPQKFFSSDKKALHLPSDMSVVHVEYTDYFFTDGIDYPVPHANMYVLINPVRLHIDYLTMLWANYFSLNLAQMVETHENEFEKKLEHVDIKIESLMPRLVISAEEKVENQPDRPDSLQIQFSKITASNTHIEHQFTLPDLQGLLSQYVNCDMFKCADFPNDTCKLTSIPKIFQAFADSCVNPYLCSYIFELLQGKFPDGFSEADIGTDAIKSLLKTNTLKRDMRCDMWGLCIDQVWLEFLGVPTSRTRPVPFVESFPLTLWICRPSSIPDGVILPGNCSAELNGNLDENSESAENSQEKKNRRKTRQLLKQYYSEDSDDSPTDPKNESSSQSNSLKDSNNCDTDNGDVQYTAVKVADFNLVAKIGGKIRAQLNNPQYLFLMRLIESLSNFQAQLNADVEDFLKGNNSPSQTFSMPLVIPDLEFAMVCPYIAELLPLSNPADILCSPNSESIDERDGDTDSDDVQGVTEGGNGMEIVDQQEQMLTVTDSNEGPHIELTETLHIEGHLSHSQSDSTIVRYAQNTDSLHISQQGLRSDSHSSEDISQGELPGLQISGQNIQYTASDSGISSIGTSSSQRSRSGSKLTPTSMKKSLTTGVSNISNFMGKIKNKLDPDDFDDSDSISIRTDISDDDDFEFLGLDDNEAPAFVHSHVSETSSMADTDDLSSVFPESTSASRAKEVVSAVVFRLSGTELLIQSVGEDMFFCLQTKAVDCEETGNTTYEDFYAKLSSQNGVVRTTANVRDGTYPIKFKMTMGPSAELLAPKGSELGVMDARIRDYEFTFRMTSILNMTSFIEDEKVAVPTPMHVSVDNFTLTLLEDRPPPNATHAQASSEPINMKIHQMFIHRHEDGIFHMSTESEESLTTTRPQISNSETTTTAAEDDNIDLSNVPVDIKNKFLTMKSQNEQLKMLCRKFDNHSQKLEYEMEKLKEVDEKFNDVQEENKKLREKLKSFALSSGPSLDDMEDLRKVNSDLEKENNVMVERVVTLEEELNNAKQEKESLLSTLQLMQEELIASEQYRQRNNSTHS